MCILSGCDYTNGIPKIGPISALKIIKTHGSIEKFLESPCSSKYTIPESFDYETSRTIFKEDVEIKIQKGTFNECELSKLLEKHDIQQINYFINKLKKLIN
jgi:5'-3' exonuclease